MSLVRQSPEETTERVLEMNGQLCIGLSPRLFLSCSLLLRA